MKLSLKQEARILRTKGFSLNEIRKKIPASKSTISVWVRDIHLTESQKKRVLANKFTMHAIEKRRNTRLHKELIKRQTIIKDAAQTIHNISPHELKLLGTALYWAEGGKANRGLVRFSNGDPKMIAIIMRFFREICKVKKSKFRGYIHIHPHLPIKRAELYWSSVTKIPLKQFYKTYNKTNISSKGLKDTLPYGTVEIYICDTKLFLTIQGWKEKIQLLCL